jgi:vesicle coat complex subunit
MFVELYFSDNEDPLVRGSALRSLCSLRLESILEYVEQPLKKSLTDLSAYVRKTGVMGILKVLPHSLYFS